ncbi:MAG: ABC transporter substrate-binding protein [Actinomycetota bacterium]
MHLRRLVTLVVASTLIAAGCGGSDEAAEPSSDTSSSSVSEPADDGADTEGDDTDATADEAAEEEPSASASEPVDDEAAPEDGTEPTTRIVSTAFGDFEVPANPERVVVMNSTLDLATAFDLGVNVIGTLSFSGGRPESSLVSEQEWARIDVLGTSVETSLEAIIAADPDLVLVTPNSEEEFELYAAAVTSVPIVLTNRWQDDARQVADARGQRNEMDVLLDDYQARADELGERIRAENGDTTIAFLRIRPGSLRVHTSVHFAGNILDDVGLQMPEMWRRDVLEDPVDNIMQRVEVISPEQVGLLNDADHIFVAVQGTAVQTEEEVAAARDEILGSALWATLPAVQADRVNFVEGYWIAGTLRAASAALDDLETYFFG